MLSAQWQQETKKKKHKKKAHETAGCGRYTVTVEIEGFEPLMRRQIKMTKYLHCSAYGSYYIPCEIVQDLVVFSIEEHGDTIEKLFKKSTREGQLGLIVKYEDPFLEETQQHFTTRQYIQHE